MKPVVVLLVFGMAIHSALASQSAVYEAFLSKANQPSWTLQNGGNWMPERYRVRISIATRLPVLPKVISTQQLCGYDDDTGQITMCPIVQITATIGTIEEQVWQELPDGREVLLGQNQSPLRIKDEAQPGAALQSPILFSSDGLLTTPLANGTRTLDLSFGDAGVWHFPIQAQGPSLAQVSWLTGMALPETLRPSWEMDNGMSVTYTGNLSLKRIR